MIHGNNLTEKKYWSESWRKIKLPARYFYENYSHQIISNLMKKYIPRDLYKNFLEIGGCPGRWADYFFTTYGMECDSLDYAAENLDIIGKNYKAIGIKGEAILGDITDSESIPKKKYDVVLSDGLIEHFVDSSGVFENHLKYLNKGGLLIVGVPNIKKSWFYDHFAKKDKVGYKGYRHVDIKELKVLAENNKLEVLYCDYVGVFNIGLVHSNLIGFISNKIFILVSMISGWVFRALRLSRESKTFSPYIYLIAKKNG